MDRHTMLELNAEVGAMVQRPDSADRPWSLMDLPHVFDVAMTQEKVSAIEVAGWTRLNQALGGLRAGEFSILCGPTGLGKTTLLANLAVNFVAAGIPTFVASVEIGPVDFIAKMASIISGQRKIESRDDWALVRKKYGPTFFSNPAHQFTNYDSRVAHTDLMADLLWAKRNKGTKIALLDNLNFMMEVVDSRNAVSIMDKVVHEWIVFVKKLGVHVIMVMHPRKPEKSNDNRVASIYEIKGSSTSIQEAQNVILFNPLEKPEHAPFNVPPEACRELKIVKCRKNGRAVGQRVIYRIDTQSERYEEVRTLDGRD